MTEDPPRLLDPAHRPLLVGIVSLVTVVATESMAISTVMPVVEDELGDLWLYGWVFSAFYLGTLVGVVTAGRAVDRLAPVVPMAVGIVVFVAGLSVGGLAGSMHVLVAGRVLQGLGAGAVPVVAYVCVSRGFPPALRPRAFAVMSTAWVVPSLVSPLLASTVADHVGWRWVFLGLIPVTAVVALVGVPAVRTVPAAPGSARSESAPSASVQSGTAPAESAPSGRSSMVPVALLVLGAGLVLGGLSAERVWVGVPLAALGIALGVGPYRALTPPRTLRAGAGLPAAVLTRGVLTFAFFSADAFVSLALTSVRGSSTRYAGVVLASASLTWTAGSWTPARLSERWGAPRLVRSGGLLLVAGSLVLAVSLSSAVPLAVWILGATLNGMGMGMSYPQLSVVTLAEAPPGGEGAATASLQMSDILGIALGTGLAGVIVTVGDRLDLAPRSPLVVVFLVAAAIAAAVAVLSSRLASRPQTTRLRHA